MKSLRLFLFGLLVAVVPSWLLIPRVALSAETIEFKSGTPTGVTQFLKRDYVMDSVTIRASLSMPAGAKGQVPAVVIKHGSGGVSDGREGEWARRLNEIGIAALVVDTFGSRGTSQLSDWADVADALNGLKALAADPRIDPKRIGIIGFSRGGRVALCTALETVRKSVVDDSLMFALHIPLYPGCNTHYVGKVTGAPLSLHLAEKDDWCPAGPCEDYARWFEAQGAPTTVTVYQGVYHGFDTGPARAGSREHNSTVGFVKTAGTEGNCAVEVNVDDRQWKRLDTNEIFTDAAAIKAYYTHCKSTGAHIGGDLKTRQQVFENVLSVLKSAFKL